MGSIAYKEVNNHYFGVYETNTRIGGEMGEFYGNLILIDDVNKNTSVWVSYSTIEKAINASPILQSQPELKNNFLNTDWTRNDSGHIYYQVDLFNWALRSAVFNISYFSNEKVSEDFFKQVNLELMKPLKMDL